MKFKMYPYCEIGYGKLLLCTVAHLERSRMECHLCTFLLASLRGFPNRDFESQCNANVYLRTGQSKDRIVV
jgi:hypothetical protein